MKTSFLLLTLAILSTSAVHAAPVKTSLASLNNPSIRTVDTNIDIVVSEVLVPKTAERRAPPAAAAEEAAQAAGAVGHEIEKAAPEAESAAEEVAEKVKDTTSKWKYIITGALGGAALDNFYHPFNFFSGLFGQHK